MMRSISLAAALGYLLAFAALAALALADDGMAACQSTHSFDVCHDQLH